MARTVLLDPSLSDDQIIQTFTPLENKFYQWVEHGDYDRFACVRPTVWDTAAQERFPDEDPDHLWENFGVFASKWFGRFRRRVRKVVQRDELLRIIWDTPCKNVDQLAKNLWTFNFCNVADLFLGESSFGGVLTGYAVDGGSHVLHPDFSYDEMSDPSNPHLLDSVILALDRKRFTTTPTAPLEHISPRKRRQHDSYFAPSFRSADGGDFEDHDPFCFLQLGSLVACTGQNWAKVRDKGQSEINDATWDETGYAVVVELNPAGYPRGPVYVVYNFREVRPDPSTGEAFPDAVDIQWKDSDWRELPHIRRLYPNCKQKFFVAKIADKLDHLDTKVPFDFDIVCEPRCEITRVKLEGSPPKIIPNDIMYTGPSKRYRRPIRLSGLVPKGYCRDLGIFGSDQSEY
ncbi:hypothetical protein OCS_04286 [Ophiocordyceps sinensis CO18]|uniref:Uncharacterized protein n=1 Tax=Ophiocordyceps sinensis (strain Co18 / CGMCC 3.14243) TaxID=911162 RepID=T5ABM7_OPHSC|nr:hypothetical protein OCS_04286 [Ophiocordyceps sinensis CO18]